MCLTTVVEAQFVLDESIEYELNAEKFHFEDGLKSIRIFDIYCDQNNLIWIVTESSLYTFNGFTFDQKINFGKLKSHPKRIFIDNNQNLWLFQPLNKTTNTFESTIAKEIQILDGQTFEPIDSKDYIGKDIKESFYFYQSNKGVIYFSTPTNPNNYLSFDQSLSTNSFEVKNNHFNYIEVDNFITYTDCEKIFIKSDTFNIDTSFTLNGSFLNFKVQQRVFSYTEKVNDDIIIHSLHKNERKSLTTFHQSYDVDFSGNIFAFQHRSFESSHPELKKYIAENLATISSLVFQSVLIDTQGNMWIGSHLGLIKISRRPVLFKNISSNGLASSRNIIRVNKDTIVICTYDGIYVYDVGKEILKKISNEIFLSICKIKNELYAFDKYGKCKILLYPSFTLRNSKNVNAIINSQLIGTGNINDNEVLLLTERKLTKYNCKTKESEQVKNPKSYIKYHSIIEHDNEIYICSSIGVYKYKKSTNNLNPLLSGYEINYVHFDLQNPEIVWLASTLGLLKFNKRTKQIKVIGNEDGLSNTSITSIKEDEFSALWMPTFTGLNRYDKKGGQLNRFYTQDGLLNNEFNYHSDLSLDNGTFLFGGTNGITIIQPKKFINQVLSFPTQKISILSGEKILRNSIHENLNINEIETHSEIKFCEKDIELRLFLHHPSYKDLRSKELSYRVYKEDSTPNPKSWVPLKSNVVNLSKRPYGQYKLEIRAVNLGGMQPSTNRIYSLIYPRPFYKTLLFRLIFMGIILLVLYNLSKVRSRNLENKTKKLEDEILERTRLIKDQNLELDKMNKTKDKLFAILAHDLKSPLITLQNLAGKIKYLIETDQAERLVDIGSSIDDKLSRLSTFLDNLLNWSLQQRNHLSYNPEAVNISELIQEVIQLYEENIRAKNLEVITKVNPSHFYFADKNSVHAIVRNIFNNALKYSNINSEIKIESSLEEKSYLLSIKDYGIGISENRIESIKKGINIDSIKGTYGEKGTGLGLVISQELMRLNLGELKISRNKINGTTVELRFPKAEVKN